MSNGRTEAQNFVYENLVTADHEYTIDFQLSFDGSIYSYSFI